MDIEIGLVTIWTKNFDEMKEFYQNVLGFKIKNDLSEYVEFENEGVRFAICKRSVMSIYNDEFKKDAKGQSFELAFPCETPEKLNKFYDYLLDEGAKSIHPPKDMPWNQRTALFADPDGNIHEIFTNLY